MSGNFKKILSYLFVSKLIIFVNVQKAASLLHLSLLSQSIWLNMTPTTDSSWQ